MQQPFTSAIAANRFGLGARPGELAAIGSDAREWLRAQLTAPASLLADGGLRSSADVLTEALALRREIRSARKSGDAAQVKKLPQLLRPVYVAEATARLSSAVSSERPFIERLVQFWSNHFAVSVDKQLQAGLAGSFEREAIRPHVLGNFGELVLAAETHPAMLLYLDNHESVGPHSQAALRAGARRRIGINENLGARDSRAAHARGGRRLHADRRDHIRRSHHRLVDWRGERALRRARARQLRVPCRAARARSQGGARAALCG